MYDDELVYGGDWLKKHPENDDHYVRRVYEYLKFDSEKIFNCEGTVLNSILSKKIKEILEEMKRYETQTIYIDMMLYRLLKEEKL